jgi:AcrR family transcriptional regulator
MIFGAGHSIFVVMVTASTATSAAAGGPRSARRGRGRPRDEAIDERVLAATLALLAEKGYAATTMTAVARRAGVGTPALYRRWSSRTELVENAVFPGFPDLMVEPTGDLRADVQRYVDAYCAVFAAPAARAAMPGLISDYQTDRGVHRRIGDRVAGSRVRDAFATMLAHDLAGHAARDRPAGQADRAFDPDDALDVLIGSVMQHSFVRPFTGRHAGNAYITEAVVRTVCA